MSKNGACEGIPEKAMVGLLEVSDGTADCPSPKPGLGDWLMYVSKSLGDADGTFDNSSAISDTGLRLGIWEGT